MIVCSCTRITDRDIEAALIALMNEAQPRLPTPGVVFGYLSAKMNCCSCAPLTVETIYDIMADLEGRGLICPYASANARGKLLRMVPRSPAREVTPFTEHDTDQRLDVAV